MLTRLLFWGCLWAGVGGSISLQTAAAQPLSKAATISLLTCAPGSETYALFGHSALRVTDPMWGVDQVYNYGTFDFETPHFYWRFLRGDLRYYLSVTSFAAFQAVYQQENRTLSEQVLALHPTEVNRLYTRLETTRNSPARYYRYQFFTDNCTTRLFELVSTTVDVPLQVDSTYGPQARTYRQLLAPYLASAPWVNLGMNLGLGWPADRPTSFRQQLFLPTELHQALAHTTRRGQPFVASTRTLFLAVPLVADQGWVWCTPTVVFLGLWVLVLVAASLPARFSFLSQILRRGLFLAVGVTGCVLLSLQLFSLHTPAHSNYQLLWLLPTHVGLAMARPSLKWLRYTTVSLALLLLGSVLGYGIYYGQLMPEIGWLLALQLFQLLFFRQQSASVAINSKSAGELAPDYMRSEEHSDL